MCVSVVAASLEAGILLQSVKASSKTSGKFRGYRFVRNQRAKRSKLFISARTLVACKRVASVKRQQVPRKNSTNLPSRSCDKPPTRAVTTVLNSQALFPVFFSYPSSLSVPDVRISRFEEAGEVDDTAGTETRSFFWRGSGDAICSCRFQTPTIQVLFCVPKRHSVKI